MEKGNLRLEQIHYNTNFGSNNITSLEEKAYKTLPIHIRRHIMQNPEKYPEYSTVLLSKRIDILQSYKNKINLDPEEIKFMLTIIRIYNHIKKTPPRNINKNHVHTSWDDFVKLYYPNFINLDSNPDDVDYSDYQDTWNKSFWLVYYTYLISYRKFYNLKNGIQENSVTLNFNRKKEKFSTFIYKQYKYLDENVSLEKFQLWGY